MSQLFAKVYRVVRTGLKILKQEISALTRPTPVTVAVNALADMTRTKPELIAENALLRQQVSVLQRSVKRPKITADDRWFFVLLARQVQYWKQALLIVQPDTLLRWHRDLFTGLWRRKRHAKAGRKQLADSTVEVIKQRLRENRLWGAERVRGALLKLGIHVSKRTLQRSRHAVRPSRGGNQNWLTFIHNHAHAVWACDFLQVPDVLFRNCFAFSSSKSAPVKSFMER